MTRRINCLYVYNKCPRVAACFHTVRSSRRRERYYPQLSEAGLGDPGLVNVVMRIRYKENRGQNGAMRCERKLVIMLTKPARTCAFRSL